jgi:hypothetical protein
MPNIGMRPEHCNRPPGHLRGRALRRRMPGNRQGARQGGEGQHPLGGAGAVRHGAPPAGDGAEQDGVMLEAGSGRAREQHRTISGCEPPPQQQVAMRPPPRGQAPPRIEGAAHLCHALHAPRRPEGCAPACGPGAEAQVLGAAGSACGGGRRGADCGCGGCGCGRGGGWGGAGSSCVVSTGLVCSDPMLLPPASSSSSGSSSGSSRDGEGSISDCSGEMSSGASSGNGAGSRGGRGTPHAMPGAGGGSASPAAPMAATPPAARAAAAQTSCGEGTDWSAATIRASVAYMPARCRKEAPILLGRRHCAGSEGPLEARSPRHQ